MVICTTFDLTPNDPEKIKYNDKILAELEWIKCKITVYNAVFLELSRYGMRLLFKIDIYGILYRD